MSRPIALLVARSAIPARLKCTGIVLALHADDEGGSIFPRLDTIAFMTGKQPNTIERERRTLLRLRVLTADVRQTGRGHRIVYAFDLARLRALTADEAKVIAPSHRKAEKKGGTGVRKRGAVRPIKGGRTSDKGGTYGPHTNNLFSTDHVPLMDQAGAAPPRSRSQGRKPSANAAFHQLAEVARDLMRGADAPADEFELHHRLKIAAAALGIARLAGSTPTRTESSIDLAARVASSEWFKHEHLAKARRAVFGAAEEAQNG